MEDKGADPSAAWARIVARICSQVRFCNLFSAQSWYIGTVVMGRCECPNRFLRISVIFPPMESSLRVSAPYCSARIAFRTSCPESHCAGEVPRLTLTLVRSPCPIPTETVPRVIIATISWNPTQGNATLEHSPVQSREIAWDPKFLIKKVQYRGFRCFGRQSRQYTGRPSVGLNGTSHSLPQSAQVAFVISRGPKSLGPLLPP